MSALDLPPFETRREDGDRVLVASGRIPDRGWFFDGHFPGEPVLPGFVQLAWIGALAEEHLGASAGVTRIEALKFRAPLLPGDAVSLRIRSGPAWRFAVHRGDDLVSEGRFGDDDPVSVHEPAPGTSPPPRGRDLPLRIPQQGAMRLLDRVIAHDPDAGTTLCEARVGEATPLLHAGRAPAWLALEWLAQGMAAQGGLALADDALPRRAFVVGVRSLRLRTRGFPVGETLWVRADHQRGETGFVVCDCALGTGAPPASRDEAQGRALAHGRLTAFVESATPSGPREEAR